MLKLGNLLMDLTTIHLTQNLVFLAILYAFISGMGLFACAIVKHSIHNRRRKKVYDRMMLYEFVGQEITAKRILIITILLTIITAVPMLVNISIKNRKAKEDFAQVFTACTKLIVRTGPTYHRSNDEAPILLEVTAPKQIAGITQIFVVDKLLEGGCHCAGDLTFQVYKQGEIVHSFTLHHGQTLRFHKPTYVNLMLTMPSQATLKKWLDTNHIYEQIENFRKE